MWSDKCAKKGTLEFRPKCWKGFRHVDASEKNDSKKGTMWTTQTVVTDITALRTLQLSNAFKFFKEIYRIKFNFSFIFQEKHILRLCKIYHRKIYHCHFPRWLCSRPYFGCLDDPVPTLHGFLPGNDNLTRLWPIKCQREKIEWGFLEAFCFSDEVGFSSFVLHSFRQTPKASSCLRWGTRKKAKRIMKILLIAKLRNHHQ